MPQDPWDSSSRNFLAPPLLVVVPCLLGEVTPGILRMEMNYEGNFQIVVASHRMWDAFGV